MGILFVFMPHALKSCLPCRPGLLDGLSALHYRVSAGFDPLEQVEDEQAIRSHLNGLVLGLYDRGLSLRAERVCFREPALVRERLLRHLRLQLHHIDYERTEKKTTTTTAETRALYL